MNPLLKALRHVSVVQWRKIDAEWLDEKAQRDFWRPLLVLVLVAVSLTVQQYWGLRDEYWEWFPERRIEKYGVLESYAWWSGWRFFGYVVMPMALIALLPGERIRDYFISLKNFRKHLWIYALLFAAIAPAVYIASQTDSFTHTYPFYRLANRSTFDLWAWEALYALQFLSLEFFFRGFMLRALAPRFGSAAIFVMIVPYCMIHYGKPMPETLGAIGAGLILGTLALRTRSIWGGVVIHISVAVMMDVLALSALP